MTTTTDLIGAALAAADLFRDGDTPDRPEIRNLVRAADWYQKSHTGHTPDGCPVCIVRALTEGTPNLWSPGEEGASVTGVVIRADLSDQEPFNRRYVDLWIGGMDRVRVPALGATLLTALKNAEFQIGDTLTVTFEGHREIVAGKYRGLKYRHHTVTITRGHA